MAKRITKLQYRRYTNELNKIKEELPILVERKKVARANGDLSENAEYDAAKADVRKAKFRLNELTELLKCEVVDYNTSPTITVGSLVRVTSKDLDEEGELLVVGETGEAMLSGILNANCPLGRIIIGNSSGFYRVGKISFYVEKVQDPEVINEFLEKHPENILENLFKDVI